MGLGVLKPSHDDHVKGTSTIYQPQGPDVDNSNVNKNLKYDRTGKSPILLVPQPSDDPNDPLNWPLYRRDLMFAALCMVTIIATTLSPILAADSLSLVLYFHRDFTYIALLTGYHLMGVGIGAIFFVPSARVWGKRHAYLLGTLLVCVSCAWAGASNKNYASLLWARIFQGLGLAPFESLVSASVGDLYFVHQRGKRMALASMATFGSAFMTPVVVGVIAHHMGWQWSFYFVSIFAGIMFFVIFFFVPETSYVRSTSLETDMGSYDNHNSIHHNVPEDNSIGEKPISQPSSPRQEDVSPPTKMSYARTLLPFNGRKSTENFIKLLLRPFPLFLQPGILWSALAQGTLIGWTVLIGIVLAAVLLEPPLFWGAQNVGYMYSAAFVGSICAFILCGLIADPSAKFMTKRNNGVYEPEFRLILVIPQLIFGGIGLYGFGWTANNIYKYSWVGPAVTFGFVVAGMVCGAVASSLYVVDAHRDIAVEAFTCLIIFKNIFSFALTFKGYDWIVNLGIKHIFVIVSSIQVAVCVLGVVLYTLGKRNRSFFQRHDIFSICRLR